MDNFFLSFLVFFGFIFVARLLSDRATKKLSDQKKAELIDLFSNSSKWSYGIVLLILAAYFLVLRYELFDSGGATIAYVGALLVFVVVSARKSHKKLRAHGFPEAFNASYLISTIIRFVGILVFFGLLMR
ncbi:MAG: hypothetical protein HRT65_14120 [Flavobacteriaceae bacterium]|nr:hypothetical protein [Flavobacteriaceae bacterium]